jgi:ribosomal protein S18 acetylase RimI-like enzyme
MKPSDVVAVMRIANQAFLETARLTSLMGRRFAQRMRGDRECLFVAETDEGEMVGFVMGSCKEDRASIGWIAVHPNHQGRGVGGMLLEAVERRAMEKGIRVVETGTPFARTFYEKHGYRCVGIRRSMLLELVGREVSAPEDLRIRVITLDDLAEVMDFIGDEEEWLKFLEAYFSAYERDADKAIAVLSEEGMVGIAIGRTDELCGELVTLAYLFVKDNRRAMDVLRSLAYVASTRGCRWFGVELPVRGITEAELESQGWEDAKLPFFWTGYRMRKELSR